MHFKQDFRVFIQEHGGDYDCVILDPPWNFNSKPPAVLREQLTYSLWDNNVDDLHWILENLGTNYIFLWTCNSLLPEVFEAIKGTGYVYKTIVTWVKQTTKGNPFYGLGNTFRNTTEQVIVLQKKSTTKKHIPALNLSMRNVIIAPVGKRTAKPKSFESELVTSMENKGLKGCYIFSGLDKQDLNIDTNDIEV